MDETGLFWKALPHKSFFMKGSCPHGIKDGKERFTVILTVSMEGEKERPMIVGKSMNPRSFPKNPSQRAFYYNSSSNAWVTTTIFGDYLKILDKSFRNQQ
jgi:hypothetical protein